jgi:O-antigen ligase/tetratricopeptide (TPR) repeat protein
VTDSDPDRLPAARFLRASGEAVLLVLANLTAWPFGSIGTDWEYATAVAVAVLAGLWAAHAVVTRHFRFRPDLVSGCLAGLVLLSVVQLVPLPLAVVRVVSPARAELHTALIPAQLERLPDESASEPRPGFVPLTVDPAATRTFAAQIIAVFVVYTAARNWLASRAAFRRLAWVALANGVALAALALAQFFSPARHLMYWSVDHGAVGYGPFVCRNHFPDFLALCVGMAVGLILTKEEVKDKRKRAQQRREEAIRAAVTPTGWDQVMDTLAAPIQLLERPVALAAALGVGFMLVSIPFSLSRGGMLAVIGAVVFTWVIARWRVAAEGGLTGWAITAVVAVIAAVLIWKGTTPIQERFEASFTGRGVDDRTPIWVAGGKQVPGYWLAGSGNGSFLRVEPLGRPTGTSWIVYHHAHNEYVEAIVEGGLVRLGLTLVLVGGVLWVVARGYRKLRERSTGGLLLGSWFGLAVLALHAVTDFAIHLPAVALFAAVVSGYAVATAADTAHSPVRRRVRRSDEPEPTLPPATTPPEKGRSFAPWLFPGLLTATAVFAALDARARYRSERFMVAAERVRQSDAPDRFDKRVAYLTQRTRVNPSSPVAWFELAQAHSDAATAARIPDGFPQSVVDAHILPALRALRTARELCPLYPEVHARLGVYARYFAASEPPLVHLERAKRLLPSDPEVWFACGAESLAAGDIPGAATNWRRSLELSPTTLKAIVRSAGHFPPADLRDRVLPDDPVVMTAAADELFPDRAARRDERVPFLAKAVAAVDRPNLTLAQMNAVAAAGDELDRPDTVKGMWDRAVKENADDEPIRNAAAGWFERQELYDRAVEQLQWLLVRSPGSRDYADRLRVAKHGQKLQDVLTR